MFTQAAALDMGKNRLAGIRKCTITVEDKDLDSAHRALIANKEAVYLSYWTATKTFYADNTAVKALRRAKIDCKYTEYSTIGDNR